MILIEPQPEPAMFESQVRAKGLAYLKSKGFSLDQPLPAKANIEPYWRANLTDLHTAYGGICAYLCVFFERVVGGGSVDHFIAKSTNARLAYEWKNYRLACSTMNSRKREYADVVDPFSDFLIWDLFWLELSSGRIYPSPEFPNVVLNPRAMGPVEKTISRLGLDNPECRDLRTKWFHEYVSNNISADYLKRKSPFVWLEAKRQRLL